MRALIQRVRSASCSVDGNMISKIDKGLHVLLGVEDDDTQADLEYIAKKVCMMRIFEDDDEKMNRSLSDVGGEIMLISQFTLYADTKKGNRPSFTRAGNPAFANEMYEKMAEQMRTYDIPVAMGTFGAHMVLEIINDGPVTIWIDSKEK